MKLNPLLKSARKIDFKNEKSAESLTFEVINRANDGENASDDVLMVIEKLLRMAKSDKWITDWECHLADTLHEYYYPGKAKSKS